MTAEEAYIHSTPLEHRKKFAQFFTPPTIAEIMVRWLLANDRLGNILEPAFGLGIFSRNLLKKRQDISIRGFEVDENMLKNARNEFAGSPQVKLLLQDYLHNDWESKYDGIICNPPYFKFHDYDNKRAIREIQNRLGYKLRGFTNLYTLFLLKSIHQLAEGGRCAYIVPSEFLNSDYGALVKSYLLSTGTLRHVIVFDFKENVFDDALTTSTILLLSKDKNNKNIGFTRIRSIEEIPIIDAIIHSYPKYSRHTHILPAETINPEIKWKTYYQPQKSHVFNHLVPFTRFARVTRGIATGANDYFTFNQEKAEEYHIDKEALIPCICHSTDIQRNIFVHSDFETLRKKGKKVYLFSPKSPFSDYIAQYIEKGQTEQIDKKYLTSCRKPWYATEKRKPAPIWVSVFNRSGVKFIRNNTTTLHLTTFHSIYPQEGLFNDISVDLLFAYLMTDTAKNIFTDNAREYGNGLQKFEPNDLNKGLVLDLTLLPLSHKQEIHSFYNKYQESYDLHCLASIEQILTEFYTK